MHTTRFAAATAAIAFSILPSNSFAAEPIDSPLSTIGATHVSQESPANKNLIPTTYEARSQTDGSVIVTVKNGKIELQDGQLVILNETGITLETLPKVLVDDSGNRFNAEYKLLSANQVQVKQYIPPFGLHSYRGGWGDYGKCIAKNTAGGIVGGAVVGCLEGYLAPAPQACAAGAGLGATLGGIGAAIGSLFGCW